jgi:hypothetical protein
MKIIWGAALAFAVCSLNTIAKAETWSCDLKGGAKTVQYVVSNGRMTSGPAPGSLTVTLNDDRFLMAFTRLGKDVPSPPLFIIIEKKSGALLTFDTVVLTVMGKSYDNDAGPKADTGQCSLLER